MQQREVTDKENTKWTCVQAYGGMQEKAAELAENAQGEVTVVCTPTGGARTARLQLAQNWFEQLKDEELIDSV